MPTEPERYKGKKIPQIPYDQNARSSSVLVLPIIEAEEIKGYLPAAATDNGDGTATLKVDTEITLNGDVILQGLDIQKWGGTDQTGADLTSLLQHLDADLSTLATETTLGALKTDFEAVDFATETTLAAILAAIDVIIDNEVPTGDIDGFNDTFTIFYTYKPGTTKVYVNGARQQEGVGNDYVEQVDHQTLIFSTIPPVLSTILVDYRKL